jgi:hypothetical protein
MNAGNLQLKDFLISKPKSLSFQLLNFVLKAVKEGSHLNEVFLRASGASSTCTKQELP